MREDGQASSFAAGTRTSDPGRRYPARSSAAVRDTAPRATSEERGRAG
jgi:hypothetical protein